MTKTPSPEDLIFRDRFEAGQVAPADFDHRAHLRLAFVYLCEGSVHAASDRMRDAIRAFLARNGLPADKYHETLTRSWTLAVRYFMAKSGPATSFDGFVRADDRLLDTRIMLTHYTRETLFSDAARAAFVAPDLHPIPPAP